MKACKKSNCDRVRTCRLRTVIWSSPPSLSPSSGYNIGVRIIDDYLAYTAAEERCQTFQDTCATLAKDGFRMFLGVTPTVGNWSADGKECSLIIEDNPLTAFVELPEEHAHLHFCNILAGAIRGALEMVRI